MSERQLRSQSQQPPESSQQAQQRAPLKLGKQQQQQPPGSSSSTKAAPKMATMDDILAAINNMQKDISDLKSDNKALTTEINELKERRSPSPALSERRRRDPSYSVEPPDSDKGKEKETSTSAVVTSEKDRFRVEELGYFDGTGDVYAFVDRLKTVSKIKTIKLVKDHLVLCFMNPAGSNEAYNWWTSEMTGTAQRKLLKNDEIDLLCDALKSRFGIPEHQLLNQLNQIKYTRKDAAEQKPATAFVGQVITLTKRLN